tara:strand:- start:593 stop:1030 length:438 start_codon:yes stop_codon:yes gene_type:complete
MGKHKYIETPEKMWEHFENYRKEVKGNPILVQDYVGKDANMVYREKERPITLDGFECWCYDNGIISDLGNYFSNLDGKYTDYLPICQRIRKTIRTHQIEGGMSGIYNPSITQRLNGLVEKSAVDVTIPKMGKELAEEQYTNGNNT